MDTMVDPVTCYLNEMENVYKFYLWDCNNNTKYITSV